MYITAHSLNERFFNEEPWWETGENNIEEVTIDTIIPLDAGIVELTVAFERKTQEFALLGEVGKRKKKEI